MNKKFYWIGIITIIAIASAYVAVNKKSPEATRLPETRDLCFIRNTEDGASVSLGLFIDPEQNVTGFFNVRSADGTWKKGSIEGKAGPVDPQAMARVADLIWTAKTDGVERKDELGISFGEGTAYQVLGELVDNGEGVFVYKNLADTTYGPPLQDTACSDSALNR